MRHEQFEAAADRLAVQCDCSPAQAKADRLQRGGMKTRPNVHTLAIALVLLGLAILLSAVFRGAPAMWIWR